MAAGGGRAGRSPRGAGAGRPPVPCVLSHPQVRRGERKSQARARSEREARPPPRSPRGPRLLSLLGAVVLNSSTVLYHNCEMFRTT